MPFIKTQSNNLFEYLGSSIQNKESLKSGRELRDALSNSKNRFPNKTSHQNKRNSIQIEDKKKSMNNFRILEKVASRRRQPIDLSKYDKSNILDTE